MLRTFQFNWQGHTLIRLPGNSEDTKVLAGERITVEFAAPHVAHSGYAKFLGLQRFGEVQESATESDTPKAAPVKKRGRKANENK